MIGVTDAEDKLPVFDKHFKREIQNFNVLMFFKNIVAGNQ